MSAITKSYGVLMDGRFQWLIRKGDLALSNAEKIINSQVFWPPAQSCTNGRYDFPLFYYLARSKDDDNVPRWHQDGQHGMSNYEHLKSED